MPKPCSVTFQDLEGIRHTVEVQAESLFEAAVLAVRAFRKASAGTAPGLPSRLLIQVVEPPVTHEVNMLQVQRWLDAGGSHPEEIVRRKRLKELLEAK